MIESAGVTRSARALWLTAAGLLCLNGPAAGQTVAITDATIYPVSGPKIEHGTLVIRDGRIVAVGTNVTLPQDARLISGTGMVVTPGLIHSISALGLGVGNAAVNFGEDENTAISGTTDDTISGAVNAAFDVRAGIDPAAVAIPVARLAGITTSVVMPTNGLIAGQALALDLAGPRVDDMLIVDPVAMVADVSDATRSAGGGSRAGALALLRRVLQDAQVLRSRRKDYEENRIRQLSAAVPDLEALYPVLDGKLPLYVRARRRSDIENALQLARDFHLKLILREATEGWTVADQLAQAGVPVVLNSRDDIPSFDGLRARLDNAALLRAAGVAVILASTDNGGIRDLRFDAGNAVGNGMSWDDALRAITLEPARAFGLADRYGSLEPGKVADIVVWNGDPFEPSSEAVAVFIRGQEMPPTSRMTELFERYRHLPPAY